MTRFGIFVDAGYLFAQGSALLVGEKQPRRLIDIHVPILCEELLAIGARKSTGSPLRTYWYDGASHGRLSGQQVELGETDGIKLRVGSINSVGEQKGVDSLMVTDLIELARNRAISDAVVLSGDEDIIIGVNVAQSFGVRVHLLGIEPVRGTQAQHLRMEVDSLTEWTRADIATFMRILPQARHALPAERPAAVSFAGLDPEGSIAVIASLVEEEVANFDPELIEMGRRHIADGTPGLPPEIDGPILAACGRAVGRKLTDEERRGLRRLARARVQGVPATME